MPGIDCCPKGGSMNMECTKRCVFLLLLLLLFSSKILKDLHFWCFLLDEFGHSSSLGAGGEFNGLSPSARVGTGPPEALRGVKEVIPFRWGSWMWGSS